MCDDMETNEIKERLKKMKRNSIQLKIEGEPENMVDSAMLLAITYDALLLNAGGIGI